MFGRDERDNSWDRILIEQSVSGKSMTRCM